MMFSRSTLREATLLLALLFAAAFASASPASAQGEVFPGDRLSLRVLEWLPARGEYRQWDALAGEYAVSPAQSVVVPFVGEVSTRDRAVGAIAEEIATRLQGEMTLSAKPAVSLQFVARANVFVMGGVQNPGAVPYEPGLTVGKAVALSGGYYRDAGGSLRLERDVISAQSAIRLAQYQAARSLARLARLESELAASDAMSAPEAENSIAVPAEMIAEEQRVLAIRRNTRETTIASIENVRALAEDQLEAVNAKVQNVDGQIESLRSELEGVQSLVDRGLAVAARSFTLERALADFEGRRIDLDLALLQAELQIGQSERDIVEVQTAFQARAIAEIQEERSELQRSLNSLAMSQALLREAAVIAPERLVERSGNLAVRIRIELMRTVDGATIVTEAADETPVLPGDTLQVEMQRPPETIDPSVLDGPQAGLAP